MWTPMCPMHPMYLMRCFVAPVAVDVPSKKIARLAGMLLGMQMHFAY